MNKQSALLLVLLCMLPGTSVAGQIENQWGMKFVYIAPGDFMMGLDDYDEALMEVPEPKPGELKDEQPRHKVSFTKGFYIGQTEVTQSQWLAIMENRPGPPGLWRTSNWKLLPVSSISWFMAQRFVEEINKLDKQYRYRLPTEAEWEYVARAGTQGLRPMPVENLEEHAWFINNSSDRAQPVATRQPNAFGVYDMLGNVWEWVADWYAADSYDRQQAKHPQGPGKGFSRVRRGGSYHCPVHLVRPGYRAANAPGVGYEVTGFRVLMEPVQSTR